MTWFGTDETERTAENRFRRRVPFSPDIFLFSHSRLDRDSCRLSRGRRTARTTLCERFLRDESDADRPIHLLAEAAGTLHHWSSTPIPASDSRPGRTGLGRPALQRAIDSIEPRYNFPVRDPTGGYERRQLT
ncbi:hypothetical protein CYV19_08465 [Natronobacterium gregoryi SP2]|uniref:Uncharacterized protein n=1 Tax=Natronobacterium gregoryi (strain ATCC 43098 / DSM 3393 / CCM 3738 / CIP 104747 / IAM 13177 / JCM 8860 / NBRC 102187 / NCIMB 2189 / SP2) TaxID=797304 RepID=L9Y811_NATGS|nr:hypothetical protein C490_08606 [Natronobacterium gregoryi SP2]PLK20627.1 hypothetical protein CYV19_08465 [Natronobacterium gregoryi SP2]